MNYSSIKYPDIANGPGCRVSLFVSGCEFHCPGCFNENTWDFNAGGPYTKNTESAIMDILKRPYIQGLTILGGEPLHPKNRKTVLELIRKAKEECPDKDIWVFSGYTYENLLSENDATINEILKLINTLVDGPFVLAEKDPRLAFRGSRNQRIIELNKPKTP